MKFLIFAFCLVVATAAQSNESATGVVHAARVCHIDPHNCQYCSKLYYCAECVQDADNCCFHPDFRSPTVQGISDKAIFMINKLCTRPLAPTKSIIEHCAKQVNPYHHGGFVEDKQHKDNKSPVELGLMSAANAEDDEHDDDEQDPNAPVLPEISAEDETTFAPSTTSTPITGMPVQDESTTSTSTPITGVPVQDESTTSTSTPITGVPVQNESTASFSTSTSTPITGMPVQDESTTTPEMTTSISTTTMIVTSEITSTLGMETTSTMSPSTTTPVSTSTMGIVGSSSSVSDAVSQAPTNAEDGLITEVPAEEATTVAGSVEETTTVVTGGIEDTTSTSGVTEDMTTVMMMSPTTAEMMTQKGSVIADNCKSICPMSKSPQKCVKCVMEHRLCCFGLETGSLERERDHYVAAKNLCFV